VNTDIVARVKLEELAKRSLTYKLVGDEGELTNTEKFLIGEAYKNEVIGMQKGSKQNLNFNPNYFHFDYQKIWMFHSWLKLY